MAARSFVKTIFEPSGDGLRPCPLRMRVSDATPETGDVDDEDVRAASEMEATPTRKARASVQ